MPDIRPQPGPQEAFCSSPADIVVYGGAAGGGKSFGLLLEGGRNVHVTGYGGVIFRRTNPELIGSGSIWEESQWLYRAFGGKPRSSPSLDWTFPTESGSALIEFRHLQHESDVHAHQGKQYAFIGFDELTLFTEKQFWYLVSRNRSTCGVRPYIRATCNPDPDSFVRRLIDWWIGEDGYPIQKRSGVIRYFVRDNDLIVWADTYEELAERYPGQMKPMSFTFIAAKLEDNPALEQKDPNYRSKLNALSYVDRMQLLYGNWNIRPSSGQFFRESMFEYIDAPPVSVVTRARAWDKAATKETPQEPNPDWTSGVLMSRDKQGIIYIEDLKLVRANPLEVEKLIVSTAKADSRRTRIAFWQDPAAAGKFEVAHFTRLLFGYWLFFQPTSKDKITFAKPMSSQAEAGNIKVVRGPWNKDFMKQMEAFPPGPGGHDDVPDSVSLGGIVLTSTEKDRLRALAKWGAAA